MKLGDVINGATLACAVGGGVLAQGISMYSDIQMLKADNTRMQSVLIDQASIKADVKVLDATVMELRQNVIYLNSHLKEATDKMVEVLIKLEGKVDAKK